MKRMSEFNIKLLLSLAAFLLFLAGLVGMAAATGWQDTLTAITRLSWAQVAILLSLSMINYVLRALRWHIFTRGLGLTTSFGENLRHYLGGFALTATPGRIGEVIRLRWIWRATGRGPRDTGALVVIDRASDLLSVAILLGGAAAMAHRGVAGMWSAAALAFAVAILATRVSLIRWALTQTWRYVGMFPRLFAMARQAVSRIGVFSRPQIFLPSTLLGLVGWFAEALAFYWLLIWLGAEISPQGAFAIFFVAMLTGGATGLPGGIGGAEAMMIAALSLANVPMDIAVPATLVIRLTTLWFAILVGLLTFPMAEHRSRLTRAKPLHAME